MKPSACSQVGGEMIYQLGGFRHGEENLLLVLLDKRNDVGLDLREVLRFILNDFHELGVSADGLALEEVLLLCGDFIFFHKFVQNLKEVVETLLFLLLFHVLSFRGWGPFSKKNKYKNNFSSQRS